VIFSKSQELVALCQNQESVTEDNSRPPKATKTAIIDYSNTIKNITPGAGSAISFANEHGTVPVHQPHDRNGLVIDAIRLRGIGRRLTKWFGWTNETFVLRQKDDNKS
jgi:hypothetical protein